MLAEMFQLFGTIGIKAEGAYKDLQQFEDRVQKTANGMHDKFQKAGESISHVGSKMQETGANMTAGVSLPLAGIGAAAVKVASDFDASNRKLESTLGLSKEATKELGNVAKDTWKDGFGESIQEVDEAVIQVSQNMKNLSFDEMQGATQNAMTLAKTFDTDVNEVTRGAGQLMNQFGLDAKETFDLLASGGQAGLNFSNEMFDNISEYAPLFKQAGFSAEEMFTIMANGTQDGSYNLDYINDLVKEFGIRVQDGSKGVTEAFAEMSPETQKVWDNFNKDKGTSADVFNAVLGDLGKMDDKVKANQLGVAVFGTKWEDMGADAVLGLNNADGALQNVDGSMKKMQKTQQEAFGVRWQKLARTTMASLEPLGQAILDIAEVALPPIIKAVEVAAKAFSSIPKPIQIGIVAILGMVAVLGPLIAMMGFMTSGVGAFVGSFRFLVPVLTKVPMLFTGILKVGPKLIGMFGGIGKALALLGRSMMTLLMNPWTIAILAIVGLVYLIYKNWDDIVKYTKQAVKWIGDVCSKAWDATVKGAKKAWNGLGKFFSGFWNGTKKLFKSASSFLGKVLEEAWKYIKQRIEYNIKIWKNIFEFGWNAIKFVFNLALSGLKKIVEGTWKFIKNSVQKAVNTWKNIFNTGWNIIKRIFSIALALIKQYVKTEFEKMKNTISSVFNTIKDIVKKAWDAIKSTFTTVLKFLKDFVKSSWESIKDTISSVMNTIKNVIQSAWNFIKFIIISAVREFVGFVITNFNKLYNTITDVVGGIKEFIVSSFKTIKKAITGAFTGVVDTVKDVFGKVGSIVKNVAKDAVSWGKDIIAGIGEGMSGMADWLIKKAKGVVSGIPKAVLKFFGIRSPSRLMMEYGGYITEGLGVGMEKMIPAVDKASELLNKAVVPPKPMKLVTDVSNQIGQMGARSADLIGKTAHPFAGQTHVEKKTDNGVTIQNATFKVAVEKLQSADDFVKMRKLLQNVVADDLMGMAVRNV
ncbi:phage tail tape measure protein [Bacillus toyonensis]|uniref:phage tail tape measure protein n=1 Tax=Bacillus toyonensis TaxID=155322 RepID=UPI00027968BE|nr:phage tail tape measure protein [Bacillus toyonensis]KNH39621.1 phage tail length tape measure protein [Bacillus thuringiensis]EJQ89449.1 phage tail tape measure protein, TP901 family, core region [Bacillus toyonensis]EOP43494.1 phage tail tape measure protein, TP901 family, core region [Bacillus toyonensis]HDR7224169.1 phage tail tape measure protein [Bacillus toyonensis]HDR7395452.1 phage tail tape measure protein [Bacillus toyonensis]